MPTYDVRCENPVCAVIQQDVICKYREFPVCPVCGGPTDSIFTCHTTIADDIPGGLWLENYGPEPIKVYSHAERKRLMAMPRVDHEGNTYRLTEMVRHVGGKHTSDWGNRIDAQTLANAKELVSRGSKSTGPLREDEDGYNDPTFRDPSVREFNHEATPAEVRAFIEATK